MKKFLSCLIAYQLLFIACAVAPAALTGTWKLISYGSAANPQPAAANFEATITFNPAGKVNGNMGCNSFGGEYKATNSQITFEGMFATLMACVDAPRMAQESAVLSTLNGSTTYKIAGNTLTITGAKGEVVVLEKK